MSNDSTLKTIIVATILCIVCSVIVSGSAVGLKERQDINKKLDVQKNLLLCAKVITPENVSPEAIKKGMERVESFVIELDKQKTGLSC